jgi:ElaB/YqjD/DUF883 family membrane-anchored ribosome-binding protein
MTENTNPAAPNGGEAKAEPQKVRDHLKAAGSAAADAVRENVSSARDAARSRARGASDWARTRFTDLQGRVESRPQSSALLALGIGVAAGFLIGALLRGGRDR